MALPQVTHLQYLVLDLIRDDPHSGRFLRDRLKEESVKMSAPSFYQLMSRLEDAQLITGWYESFVIEGQTIKERKYEITPKGKRTVANVQAFYSRRITDRTVDELTEHNSKE